MEKKSLSNTAKSGSLLVSKNRLENLLKEMEADIGKPLAQPYAGNLVYLLIDCSFSMSEENKLFQARDGAIRFSQDSIEKGYAIGIICFASSIKYLCDPLRDISKLKEHISNISAKGSTNMATAIQEATAKLQNRHVQRAIVIITDGMPDDREATLNAAQAAKLIGIEIITIGTDGADRKFLSLLASRDALVVSVSRHMLQEGIVRATKLLPSKSD